MNIPPKLLSTSFAFAIAYLMLLLFEDVFGINKKQRWILAIGIAFIYYKFGDQIIQFIRGIFSAIGL